MCVWAPFQFFAARGDVDAVRLLADYAIDRHYPGAESDERPYLALLRAVTERQASLISSWMQVGFIHGVMNTDNMAVSGETIDFGPCAFMDTYDPATVFSSIDASGRYAYANQPPAAQWNLARFAETLLPIIDPVPQRAVELASEVVATFVPRFEASWLAGMRRKLGLFTTEDGDLDLVGGLLDAMHRNQADFTLTFRRLSDAARTGEAEAGPRGLFADPRAWDAWAGMWRSRLAREPQEPAAHAAIMRQVNPAFIPRNHRIEEVIDAAVERDDFAPFAELLDVLSRPYEDQKPFEAYANPPQPHERVLRTFCGT